MEIACNLLRKPVFFLPGNVPSFQDRRPVILYKLVTHAFVFALLQDIRHQIHRGHSISELVQDHENNQ